MTTIVCGYIDKDGSILSGSGFRVNRVTTGRYTVSFDSPFSAAPACVVTQVYPQDFTRNGKTLDNAIITNIDRDKFQYATGDHQGANSDRAASFIAVG